VGRRCVPAGYEARRRYAREHVHELNATRGREEAPAVEDGVVEVGSQEPLRGGWIEAEPWGEAGVAPAPHGARGCVAPDPQRPGRLCLSRREPWRAIIRPGLPIIEPMRPRLRQHAPVGEHDCSAPSCAYARGRSARSTPTACRDREGDVALPLGPREPKSGSPDAERPLAISVRASGIRSCVGYQRPWRIGSWLSQDSVHGSNVKTVFSPVDTCAGSLWRLPPITSTRPSARSDVPAPDVCRLPRARVDGRITAATSRDRRDVRRGHRRSSRSPIPARLGVRGRRRSAPASRQQRGVDGNEGNRGGGRPRAAGLRRHWRQRCGGALRAPAAGASLASWRWAACAAACSAPSRAVSTLRKAASARSCARVGAAAASSAAAIAPATSARGHCRGRLGASACLGTNLVREAGGERFDPLLRWGQGSGYGPYVR
jgi:hypothetical protein